MKALFKFNFVCRRREPNLTGLFIANKDDVKYLIDHKLMIHFGEVAGKHSDICGYVEQSEISFVSSDPNVIKLIKDHDLETGYNPLNYNFAYWKHDMSEEIFQDMSVSSAIKILQNQIKND